MKPFTYIFPAYKQIYIVKLKNYFQIVCCCFLLLACDNFTDVALPESELTSPAVFEDPATVNAAFASIYAKLRDDVLVTGQTSGINVLLGLYADELDYYGVPGEPADFFYRHAILPSNTEVASIWSDTYNLIYASNSILEGVQASKNLSQEYKDKFRGEALFIRAYLHSYLLQLYGAIPYITTTDYHNNKDVSRLPENEVNQLLIQDLLEAQSLLAEQGLANERIKPSAPASTALLARIYLYQKDYASAAAEASQIINNTNINLGETTEFVFTKNSPTTIWQLKPESGNNTWEAITFIFVGPPSFLALSPDLVTSFEAGDSRKANWIGEVNAAGQTYYYPFKYKVRQGSGNEYSILLRLAEQYLIRAEARLYLGDLDGAKTDLNLIRNRAALPPITTNIEDELKLAIENERRHELFTEQGHRWFDLKRTARANEILGPIKPNWHNTDILLPIPETELNLNPNLQPQNPGY